MGRRRSLVHGVGINDANYTVQINHRMKLKGRVSYRCVWRCPFYSTWASMLCRCYSLKWKSKYPTYIDTKCCDEWLYFSNFKAWMETQDWEGKQLDKDLLSTQNLYCPENCIFISQSLNKFLTVRDNDRGPCLLGVYFNKVTGKYSASISWEGNRKRLGNFSTELEAHLAWYAAKRELAQLLVKQEGLCVAAASAFMNKVDQLRANVG